MCILDEEIYIAERIVNSDEEEVITLLYDTTTRDSIDGEWMAFLVKFGSDQTTHRLRPLMLAYEDRANIVKLFIEQMKRLAIAGETTEKIIWEKITAIMTDSVAKNLSIAVEIAKLLKSEHVPFQLLCSAHFCENIDRKCLETIAEGEEKIHLKQEIMTKMPALSAFLRANKTVVEIAIEACTKLVMNTGHKTSLYKQFLDVCDQNDKNKKIGLYKQRRFTKLGFCAGAIVHHVTEFQTLLKKFHSNLHSQACKLYIETPFIIDSMIALSKITELVTLPYLDMVQNTNNSFLIKILPQLYNDLQNHNLNTLSAFLSPFNFKHPPISDTQSVLIKIMSIKISNGLLLQRGREYGFSETTTMRATKLTEVPANVLDALPTHNLDCERELSIFDQKVSRWAGGFSHKSTLIGLRDEMVLYKAQIRDCSRTKFHIFKELDVAETSWTELQQSLYYQKQKEKTNEAQKSESRWKDLLLVAKSWNGPCESKNAINAAERRFKTEPELRKFFKTEIIFNKLSNFHPSVDYGVNSKTIAQLKETLMKIVGFEEAIEYTETAQEVLGHLKDILNAEQSTQN